MALATVFWGASCYGQDSEGKVSKWVQQLDADQFVLRKRATENLIAADVSAVAPVVQAVSDGSLEVVVRGIMILRVLALSEKKQTADAAYAGLEKLSSSRVTSSARRAATALITVAEMREARALQILQRLGAKLGQGFFRVGKKEQITLPQVVIGPAWKGQDKDLSLLKWVVNFQAIALEGPEVTDEWLEEISQLEHLRGLEIRHANITDDGIKHLRELAELRSLHIYFSPVTDQILPHLEPMQRVLGYILYGTNVTEKGVSQLRSQLEKKRPNAFVDLKRGALLGVSGVDVGLGVSVTVVREGSAADGQLALHDIITKYNGKEVKTFEELTKLIAQNAPNDAVELEIRRNGQPAKRTIKLGAW